MDFDGVLFFPVTPFQPDGALAPDVLAKHVDRGVSNGPGGVFVACGTGEFHALAPDEYELAVRAAVEATAGRVPVVAGAGGALPLAVEFARAARRAGAQGLLLLPPYLVSSPPEGISRYVREIAAVTDLPVIIYQRPSARFTPETVAELARLDTVIGFKDGVGDFDLMTRVMSAVRGSVDKPFAFFNGLPTAEVTAPAFYGMGVRLYSSAVFAFLPEVARCFHEALGSGDTATVNDLLDGFYLPFVRLRDRVPGYAVSLIKAGVRLRGLDVGGVRAPLVDPTREDIVELERLIEAGIGLAGRRSR